LGEKDDKRNAKKQEKQKWINILNKVVNMEIKRYDMLFKCQKSLKIMII